VPGAREVLVSGQGDDGRGGVFRISLNDGSCRPALRSPAVTFVQDISKDGDLLVAVLNPRMRMETGTRSPATPRDLSWLDWSLARDLMPDGSAVLFDETGLGVATPQVFLRGTDGSPAVHIAEGDSVGFSPDGRTALIADPKDPTRLELVPIGIGETVGHSFAPIRAVASGWFPDGRALCIAGYEPGRRTRLYRYDLASRTMEPFSEEGSGRSGCFVSPDGRSVLTQGPKGAAVYPVAGGEPRALGSVGPQHRGIGWSRDGGSVFVFERGVLPAPVLRVDVEHDRSETWMEIRPRSESGVWGVNSVLLSADGERYVASYPQILASLYVARGVS
jgi:Tol biopolymer transport system component